MNRIAFLLAIMLAAGTTQAAQLYRWVDDKGRVEWRDTPPPATAKKVEQRSVGGSVIETSELPYSVQQAVRNAPLTLYVDDCGDACNKAKAHLNRRNLPFTQKNPRDNIDAYKKLTNGGMEVPLLFVGREAIKGYEEGQWDAALDNAGYPRTVIGPRPAAKPAPAARPATPPSAEPAQPAANEAPPPAQ